MKSNATYPRRSRKQSPTERFIKQLQDATDFEPLLPVLVHLVERWSRGVENRSAADYVFANAVARHPYAPIDAFQRMAEDFRKAPEDLVRHIVPRALMHLRLEEPLDIKHFVAGMMETRASRDSSPLDMALHRLRAPVIDYLSPAPGHYRPYDQVVVHGSGFSEIPEQNTIVIWRKAFLNGVAFKPDPVAKIVPHGAEPDRLIFRWPEGLEEGQDYYLDVRTAKSPELHSTYIQVVSASSVFSVTPIPTLPMPFIAQVSPPGQRPSQHVIIDGTGFAFGTGDEVLVHVDPLNKEDFIGLPIDPVFWLTVSADHVIEVLSATQIKLRFSRQLPPGQYMIQVVNKRGTTYHRSNQVIYRLEPWNYVVKFSEFECLEESSELSGSDEIVTTWAVASDEGYVWTKITGEYTGVDAGGKYPYRPEDSIAFNPNGTFHPVKYALLISTQMFEWDEGDVKTWVSALGIVEEVANGLADIAKEANPQGNASAIVILKAVATLSKVAAKVFPFIAGSDADLVATQVLFWNSLELLDLTADPTKRSHKDKLDFEFADEAGHYRAFYEIRRERP